MIRKTPRLGWIPILQVITITFIACWGISIHTSLASKKNIKESEALVEAAKKLPRPAPLYRFPDGGRRLYPDYRLVALYGVPNTPTLGALGDQSLKDSILRVKNLAKKYQPLTRQHVMPAFEIITTVASSTPTDNGDYSQNIDAGLIRKWIMAARDNDIYVVLDLQPGRSNFLSQAKTYRQLLILPNVGLALDPEWRVGPGQIPMKDRGSVDIHEVNATAAWLANLVRKNKLPQKLFLLHEFRTTMIPQRKLLDTSRKELAYTVQMDGQGEQSVKNDTWRTIISSPPSNTEFGWKNFYKMDPYVLTPSQTMDLRPTPSYISYQ